MKRKRPSCAGQSALSIAAETVGDEVEGVPASDEIPDTHYWLTTRPADENYDLCGDALSRADPNLYRAASPSTGLLVLQRQMDGGLNVQRITPDQLWILLVDKLRIVSLNAKGEPTPSPISARHLRAMLGSEMSLRHFRPLSEVANTPAYVADSGDGVRLLRQGYHQLDDGHAILCTYTDPPIAKSIATIERFLDAMEFDSAASRTNSIAAALTVLLRRLWPGGRPLIYVSADRSHSGKGTVVDFITGVEPIGGTIGYTSTSWALEKSIHDLLRERRDLALLQVDNADLGGRETTIRSAVLERILTDPAPVIGSAKSRDAVRLTPNNLIIAITTNIGQLSPDLLNRCLPIHLTMAGDVHTRRSPIGNPRHEFLPQNRESIAAELHGMIARWQAAGSPLDMQVIHPFSNWARVVGGILKANDFCEFLANYGPRRAADDPVKVQLAILGARVRNDEWYRAEKLVEHVAAAGILKVVPEGDRQNSKAMARGIGVTLSKHIGETVEWSDPDTGKLHRFRIEKTVSARRWTQYDRQHGRARGSREPHHRYRFVPVVK